jgi:hypothetical protein
MSQAHFGPGFSFSGALTHKPPPADVLNKFDAALRPYLQEEDCRVNNWGRFINFSLQRLLRLFDEPALHLFWSRQASLGLKDVLNWLERARHQHALPVAPAFTIQELRGFATCGGILPGPLGVPAARRMKLVVISDSTCLCYPKGKTLKQPMLDKGWVGYQQLGGAGRTLREIATCLQEHLHKKVTASEHRVVSEDTCVLLVWNGNEFASKRYKGGYAGDLQKDELEQLKLICGLKGHCPRIAVVSTTDNTAWNLPPVFKKWMAQSLAYFRAHDVTVIPFDSFIARTRALTVVNDPMHLRNQPETWAEWDFFFGHVAEFMQFNFRLALLVFHFLCCFHFRRRSFG